MHLNTSIPIYELIRVLMYTFISGDRINSIIKKNTTMKKLTGFVAVLLICISSFADDSSEVAAKVKSSFQKAFPAASDLTWKKSGDIYFASFKLNDQSISAVYDSEGELKSSSRSLLLSQVPLRVLFAVQQSYSGYAISDKVSEVFSNSESKYFVNVENEKNKIQLRVDATGDISVENKEKK